MIIQFLTETISYSFQPPSALYPSCRRNRAMRSKQVKEILRSAVIIGLFQGFQEMCFMLLVTCLKVLQLCFPISHKYKKLNLTE